ncbi:MAG: methyltransferase domain-containing protein [Terracidiphilus sp.]
MLSRWTHKKQDNAAPAPKPGGTGPKVPRHSGGWAALRKRLEAEPGLNVVDAGYTSSTNLNYLTSLGHSVFLADPVRDAWTENWLSGTDEDGNPVWNTQGFLEQSLNFCGRTFDVVLLWTVLDYLPESLVAPVVAHLYSVMNPGGQVLAFFHTRTQGDETVRCRFHLTAGDDVEMQSTHVYPIQRAFTNRSIERLFAAWSGFRQFLAKDSVSEAIITR